MSDIEVVGDRLPSTLADHEAVIERGLQSFVDVGNALTAIRAGKLYKEAGYESFDAYMRERWDVAKSQGYRLMIAASTHGAIARELSPMGDIPLPNSERQVRELAALEPEQQVEAWTQAVEDAGGEQPTAEQVKAAAAKVTTTTRTTESTKIERDVDLETGEIVGAGKEGKPAPAPTPLDYDRDAEQEWEEATHPPRPEPIPEPELSLAEQRARDWEEAKARHARQLQRLISLWPYIDDWADHDDDYRADVLAHLTDHDRMLLARIEARITGQHVFPLDKEAA